MQEYFHRQIQLWGLETQERLADKKIAIIGSGGLGSSLAFALGASGIGEIHMVDFDTVSIHNIHRQIAFVVGDEGRNKALVNAYMMQKRSPFVSAVPHECDFETFSTKGIAVDLIIDATDNLQTRSDIDKYAKSTATPWVYGSVEAFHGQVCFFDKASFGDVFKVTAQKPEGIAAPMVMNIASLQANLALRYLAGLSVVSDILYYVFFNNLGEFVTQKFSLPKE